jgi:AAA domain
MNENNKQPDKPKFQLNIIKPYSTFSDDGPTRIPYCIDGLLPEGGFSILGAKPKSGKSSMSRCEAVAVAKGIPFLGRDTVRGETLLISLEDPCSHVDNCLCALGWNPETDAAIHIVDRLAPSINESIEAIGDELAKRPDVRLVIVDTFAKLLRVTDQNDYSKVLPAIEKVHDLARKFKHVHIQGLVHCKKVGADDPFDSLLGSTALRGEPDSNIVIYKESGKHVIVTETRIGKSIPPTILEAELTEIAGADVVKSFTLGAPFDSWSENKAEKREKREAVSYQDRIIDALTRCDNLSAPQQEVLDMVKGRKANLIEAIHQLQEHRVVEISGTPHSNTDPLKLTLKPEALPMHDMGNGRFEPRAIPTGGDQVRPEMMQGLDANKPDKAMVIDGDWETRMLDEAYRRSLAGEL